MKTTIDLPDALLHEAKVMAAQRHTSLNELVKQGLEHVLHSPPYCRKDSDTETDDELLELDEFNVPAIKPRGVKITNDGINRIRQEEGI